jgi:hypothetical protein
MTENAQPDQKVQRELRESAHHLVGRILGLDFEILVRTVGPERTLSAYKELGRYSGRAMARNFIQRLGLEGDGVRTLAIPFYAAINNSIGGKCDRVEVRERGAEVRITSCPWSAGIPERCIVSHVVNEGIAEEINPEYEIIFTHHLNQGDPYCRYVVKRKSDSAQSIMALGSLIETLPAIELPSDERDALSINMASALWISYITMFEELLGKERTMAILKSPSEDLGREFGKELGKRLGLSGMGVRETKRGVEILGTIIGQEQRTLFEDDDETRVEVLHCVLEDGPVEACRQFEFVVQGMCQSFAPNCQFKHESMRPAGNDRCVWTVRRKVAGRSENKAPEREEDPTMLLALRYAKGEISEEELDRRMAYLRKHGLVK